MTGQIGTAYPLSVTLVTAFVAGNVDADSMIPQLNAYQSTGPDCTLPDSIPKDLQSHDLRQALEYTLKAEQNVRGKYLRASDGSGGQTSSPCQLFEWAAKVVDQTWSLSATRVDPVACAVSAFLNERAGEMEGIFPEASANLYSISLQRYLAAQTHGGYDLSAAQRRVKIKLAKAYEESANIFDYDKAGDLYLELGETQKAVEMFTKYFITGQLNGDATYSRAPTKKLASAYMKLKMFKEAMDSYLQYFVGSQRYAEAIKVAEKGAKYHAGIGEFEKAGELLIEGAKCASKLEDDPMLEIKMCARALEMYRLAELTNTASAENGNKRTLAAGLLASGFFAMGHTAAALQIDDIELGKELYHPQQREEYGRWVAAYADAARGYEIVADAFSARELSGSEAEPRYLQAMAMMTAGRYKEASDAFAKVSGAGQPEVLRRRGYDPVTVRISVPQTKDADYWKTAAPQIDAYLNALDDIRYIESRVAGDTAAFPQTEEDTQLQATLIALTVDSILDPGNSLAGTGLLLLVMRHFDFLLKTLEEMTDKDGPAAKRLQDTLMRSFDVFTASCAEREFPRLYGNLQRLRTPQPADPARP